MDLVEELEGEELAVSPYRLWRSSQVNSHSEFQIQFDPLRVIVLLHALSWSKLNLYLGTYSRTAEIRNSDLRLGLDKTDGFPLPR